MERLRYQTKWNLSWNRTEHLELRSEDLGVQCQLARTDPISMHGKKVFKKQMKVFAVEMLQEYALSSDNDVDDALVLRVKNAMRLGAV